MSCRSAPLFGAALALTLACASPDAPEELSGAEPVLVPALDENAEPNVFETTLEARVASKKYPGSQPARVWTYNGTVPGPLIDTEVGTELIVHFSNDLPEDTTIHWHGVRLPADMDGTLAMQEPVEPGEGFEYRFVLKDAGLYWFHPHVRSAEQVEKGLYGVIRVRGGDEPEADSERILVLDDVSVLPNGSFPTYLDDESKMLGRQGNVLLVNGVSSPAFRWRAGSVERLRIVNVANGRFFNLALPGYLWRVIGTDGGMIPRPYDTERLLISPGERYDVLLVVQGSPGDEVTLVNEPYERGHDTGSEAPMPVARFIVSDEPPLPGRALPDALPEIERLEDGPVDHALVLDEEIRDGELVFTVNDSVFPDVPVLEIERGSTRRFEVENASMMDHPFHVHGTFFQILSVDGDAVPDDALANKDTVIVRQQSSMTLVARFDEPGHWMYHCHILEHAEGGMMGEIDVTDAQ